VATKVCMLPRLGGGGLLSWVTVVALAWLTLPVLATVFSTGVVSEQAPASQLTTPLLQLAAIEPLTLALVFQKLTRSPCEMPMEA